MIQTEHVYNLLQDRLEFFESLSRRVVRMCKGQQCPHFNVCPFAPEVKDIQLSDRIPCAVEREVVKDAVENFVIPKDNTTVKPPVDPRRPEQGLLFQELVELLVKKARISMYLQEHDIMISQWEILKDAKGGGEHFDTMNEVEHPLLNSLDKTKTQILKVMKELGITPEFLIRQGLYVDDTAQMDSEKRARELAENKVRDVFQGLLESLPEEDPTRLLIAKALQKETVDNN